MFLSKISFLRRSQICGLKQDISSCSDVFNASSVYFLLNLFLQMFQQDFHSLVVLDLVELRGDGRQGLLHLRRHRFLTAVQETEQTTQNWSLKGKKNKLKLLFKQLDNPLRTEAQCEQKTGGKTSESPVAMVTPALLEQRGRCNHLYHRIKNINVINSWTVTVRNECWA